MARGESGVEAGVAAKQRRREVGCFPAREAEAANEGNMCDTEAWRDETNKLKKAPAALIVRLPSGSACHGSRRLVKPSGLDARSTDLNANGHEVPIHHLCRPYPG